MTLATQLAHQEASADQTGGYSGPTPFDRGTFVPSREASVMPYEMDRHVGRIVQFHRVTVGVSVRSLSIRTGISEERLCDLEAGRAEFDRTTLLALADGLGIPVIAMLDAREETDFTCLAKANIVTAALADLFLRDYRRLARNPVFRALYQVVEGHDR